MKIEQLIRGAFYGSLLGDVYGAPFELKSVVGLDSVLRFIDPILSEGSKCQLRYTDDTAMAFDISESLQHCKGFNASYMAQTFSQTFDKAPACRLYGGSIRGLFRKMSLEKYQDPQAVAAKQFNGTGSLGNGGGMRITPAALYGLTMDVKDFNELIMQVTSVTHSHPFALYGALLQAHGIRRLISHSLQSLSTDPIDVADLLEGLRGTLRDADLTKFAAGGGSKETEINTAHALMEMLKHLEYVEEYANLTTPPSITDVVNNLGNGEHSLVITTALYVFLRSLKGVTGIDYKSIPLRCTAYASNIGYDTDTIGSMACALAGAYTGANPIVDDKSVGTEHFPTTLLANVEGLERVNGYIDWLIEHYKTNEKTGEST